MNFNRRLFLRGAGGVALAAPFLSSVAERAAKAQGVPILPEAPKRLIVMFTHHGCFTNRWFPENSHGALTAADFEGTSLEAVAPHADKILLPRGIRAMNEWTSAADLGQGNDPHVQVVGSYFTCVPITPHTGSPFDITPSSKLAMPTAPSLDHVCARQLNPEGTPFFLNVAGGSDGVISRISYSAGEEPYPGISNLTKAFEELTGLFSTEAPLSPDSYQVLRGQSLVDLVKDDLETLERFDMSSSDKDKLSAWKELLDQTGKAIPSAQCGEELAAALGLTATNIDTLDSKQADLSSKVTDELDGADLYSNLAVLAALCDHNRVIFLKYPGNYTYRGLGLEMEIDNMAHRIDGAGLGGVCAPDVDNLIQTVDRFYAEKFAHLVGQLDSFSEGDGTLLDNCATVWFQENSDGCAMNLNNMPIIQAGGCGDYFKTGYAVNVDDGSSDLHRGNSDLPCKEGEFSDHKIAGTPREIGNAPINKYYCNLMNAIGVRADETGFPTEGGSQEVTHYGMYDDTTDFTSGGANPAKINSPGGFEELKANS